MDFPRQFCLFCRHCNVQLSLQSDLPCRLVQISNVMNSTVLERANRCQPHYAEPLVGLYTDNTRIAAVQMLVKKAGSKLFYTSLRPLSAENTAKTSPAFPGFKLLVWFLWECEVGLKQVKCWTGSPGAGAACLAAVLIIDRHEASWLQC